VYSCRPRPYLKPAPGPSRCAWRQLLARTTHVDPLSHLTPRERDVLAHMAQGHTSASIAEQLYVSQSAVEKHISAIFDKLRLPQAGGYSRRVLAVIRYLGS
jgi:DNA-binding NarL/FixJ family response regulator